MGEGMEWAGSKGGAGGGAEPLVRRTIRSARDSDNNGHKYTGGKAVADTEGDT